MEINESAENLKKKYFVLDELIKTLQNDRNEILEEYIKTCPYELSEKIIVYSWQHLGREGVVTEIKGKAFGNHLRWIVKGHMIDKQCSFEFDEYDYNRGPARLKLKGK